MFNELKSLLPNVGNLLELWFALFFIVASTLVCITIAKRMGRDCSALGGALWRLTKVQFWLAWDYAITIYDRWRVCRAWRNAMIQHSFNQSQGIVWKFHRSLSGVLVATGTTNHGTYTIEAMGSKRTDPNQNLVCVEMEFDLAESPAVQMARGGEPKEGMTYENEFLLTGAEMQDLGLGLHDYVVNKLCVAVKTAMQKAECHAWDMERKRLEDEVVWEWEESVFSTGGRSTRRVFTCGGYDCYYDVESIQSEFSISVELTLRGQGRKPRSIASRNARVKSQHTARLECADVEEEMKLLARERNDANMDTEFDEAIDNAPTPLEYLAGKTKESPAEPPVEHEPALEGEGKTHTPELEVVGVDGDDPIIARMAEMGTKMASVVLLAEHYDLPISQVRETLAKAGVELGEDNDRFVASFDYVKGLFEPPAPETALDGGGERIPTLVPLPEKAVELSLTHDSLCSKRTLADVFNLSLEKVKEILWDIEPTQAYQNPKLYRLGDVLYLFGVGVVFETEIGVAPRSLPKGYVPLSMTKAELAVHFNVAISVIDQVLDGVEPDVVEESTNRDGHDYVLNGKWNTSIVEKLLANLETPNDTTS